MDENKLEWYVGFPTRVPAVPSASGFCAAVTDEYVPVLCRVIEPRLHVCTVHVSGVGHRDRGNSDATAAPLVFLDHRPIALLYFMGARPC